MFMSNSVTSMSKFVVSLSIFVMNTLYSVMCHLVTSHFAIFLRRSNAAEAGEASQGACSMNSGGSLARLNCVPSADDPHCFAEVRCTRLLGHSPSKTRTKVAVELATGNARC